MNAPSPNHVFPSLAEPEYPLPWRITQKLRWLHRQPKELRDKAYKEKEKVRPCLCAPAICIIGTCVGIVYMHIQEFPSLNCSYVWMYERGQLCVYMKHRILHTHTHTHTHRLHRCESLHHVPHHSSIFFNSLTSPRRSSCSRTIKMDSGHREIRSESICDRVR